MMLRQVLGTQTRRQEFANATDALSSAVDKSRRICQALLVLLLPPPGPELSSAEAEELERLALRLSEVRGVRVVRVEELLGHCQWLGDAYHCPFLELAAHTPYSPLMFSCIAGAIARELARAWAPARKVVVLDCDNTLWGGAVGELGPMGVELSEGE